jgi:ABC-2 type transport system permease protein
MRTIAFIIQKEFLQIFRNRIMLGVLVVMPVIQLVVLTYAATFEIRKIPVFVVDLDRSTESRLLVERFAASENFTIAGYSASASDGDHALLANKAIMVLGIPPHAGRDLAGTGHAPLSLRFDAVDGFTANVARQYALDILSIHNDELFSGGGWGAPPLQPSRIDIMVSRWFNPHLDYRIYMVPGILVLLVTVIGGLLTALNVVREKEIGTMEQINVTPVTKIQFIVGKLVPFIILALALFTIGLLLGRFWFGVPVEGSLVLVYMAVLVYLLVVLGLGLMVSTLAETQQQAIFITWFFFVVFLLLSGLFTPIDSMPQWAQWLTLANPVAWFMDVIRRVMLAGAGFKDVWKSIFVLACFALLAISMAVLRYRKAAR